MSVPDSGVERAGPMPSWSLSSSELKREKSLNNYSPWLLLRWVSHQRQVKASHKMKAGFKLYLENPHLYSSSNNCWLKWWLCQPISFGQEPDYSLSTSPVFTQKWKKFCCRSSLGCFGTLQEASPAWWRIGSSLAYIAQPSLVLFIHICMPLKFSAVVKPHWKNQGLS